MGQHLTHYCISSQRPPARVLYIHRRLTPGKQILPKTPKGRLGGVRIPLPSPLLSSASSFASESGDRKHMEKTDDWELERDASSFLALCLGPNLAFQCSSCESGKNKHVCSLNLKGQFKRGILSWETLGQHCFHQSSQVKKYLPVC